MLSSKAPKLLSLLSEAEIPLASALGSRRSYWWGHTTLEEKEAALKEQKDMEIV